MSKEISFFEVMDRRGDISWGGTSPREAVEWFRRGLDNSIFVSLWDETDPDNPVIVGGRIELTRLVLAVLTADLEREPKERKAW